LLGLADRRLNLIDEGEGPPIVLIHGRGANHRMWALQLDGFCEDFRCLAPDLSCSGQSDLTPPGPFTPAQLARNVAEACGVRAVIVGQSMGGLVAQALAIHQPEFVAALVLVGTVCEGRPQPPNGIR
jgi:pimeloyl-ACP methyl ester carboxylesterase